MCEGEVCAMRRTGGRESNQHQESSYPKPDSVATSPGFNLFKVGELVSFCWIKTSTEKLVVQWPC